MLGALLWSPEADRRLIGTWSYPPSDQGVRIVTFGADGTATTFATEDGRTLTAMKPVYRWDVESGDTLVVTEEFESPRPATPYQFARRTARRVYGRLTGAGPEIPVPQTVRFRIIRADSNVLHLQSIPGEGRDIADLVLTRRAD